jgi:DNA-binding NtrC family response regulator
MTTMNEQIVGKILIVDDEIALKDALVNALTKQSYEAHGYTSGHEALEALRREAFDLLISDLMMPEIDGIALVSAALEIDPHLVPIIMTGQHTNKTAEEAKKAGAFDYVVKPFRLKMLMPILTRAMQTRRLGEESRSSPEPGVADNAEGHDLTANQHEEASATT